VIGFQHFDLSQFAFSSLLWLLEDSLFDCEHRIWLIHNCHGHGFKAQAVSHVRASPAN